MFHSQNTTLKEKKTEVSLRYDKGEETFYVVNIETNARTNFDKYNEVHNTLFRDYFFRKLNPIKISKIFLDIQNRSTAENLYEKIGGKADNGGTPSMWERVDWSTPLGRNLCQSIEISNDAFTAFKEISCDKNGFLYKLKGAFREMEILLELKGVSGCLEILHWSFDFEILSDPFMLIETKKYDSDLEKILPMFKTQSLKCKIAFAIKIIASIKEIHSKDIIHADLKPLNILIRNKNSGSSAGTISPDNIELVIGDFGISRKVNDTPTYSMGTIAYQAPEIIQQSNGGLGSVNYTKAIDIYSFGILLNQLLSNEKPIDFYTKNETVKKQQHFIYKQREVNKLVCQDIRPTLFEETTYSNPSIITSITNLVEECWDKNSFNRPTASNVFDTLKKISNEL